MRKRRFLFISPHLDDAVLSCGGYIAKLRQYSFPVTVMTLFSGSPRGKLSELAEELHADWRLSDDAPAIRRGEDMEALGLIGAEVVHANFLDCIYRRKENGDFVYQHIMQVLGQNANKEHELLNEIEAYLYASIRGGRWDIVFAPLALGGHVDHHIVKDAVLRIRERLPKTIFHFYEDLPYVISETHKPQLGARSASRYLCLSEIDGNRKYAAMRAYQSQIKCAAYPTGIDIDAIIIYGRQAGKAANQLGERVWYRR